MKGIEVNFDGLVGPTHNYAGLSFGNVASARHAGRVASPRAAALQGLAKMKALADLGAPQAVLPPHERPHIGVLRRLGFAGTDAGVLAAAWRQAPAIVTACCSASAMWVANAATVSPWADTADGRTHFTPANLCSMFHRSLEPAFTSRLLKALFADGDAYVHHDPLPVGHCFCDEGAANHTRFCVGHEAAGVELFVFGAYAFAAERPGPKRFPARQSFEASQAIARLHGLAPDRTIFAQQHPAAVDAGVFHNDVIAVGHRNLFFFHENAFLEQRAVLDEIADKMAPVPMHLIEVPAAEVSLKDAVSSYLFNTQLIDASPASEAGEIIMIAPIDCEQNPAVKGYLDALVVGDNPIKAVHYLDLHESMRNGGGPACLRLRIVMHEQQRQRMRPRVFMDDALYDRLIAWVDKHYREALSAEDLGDPGLLVESRAALDELTRILNLGPVYDFQGSSVMSRLD